jgi:hypothetical protein
MLFHQGHLGAFEDQKSNYIKQHNNLFIKIHVLQLQIHLKPRINNLLVAMRGVDSIKQQLNICN